ncbi:MAG: Aldehyde dehydrogenase, partial [uncultured Solirubrobacteraceae bacterium]
MATTAEQGIQVRDRIYIGGEWVQSTGTGTLEVVNSATEQVMGSVPEGTADDVDRAVDAARAAFASWSQTSVDERTAWMARIAEALGARMEEIAVLIAQEVGMPVKLAHMIQAGLPTMDFGAMPQLMAETAW